LIPVSHVGTLPRPDSLERICARHEIPRDNTEFASIIPGLVTDVVRRQVDLGVSIVNDGELGKKGGFTYYAQTRLSGIERRAPEHAPLARSITARDERDFPGYYTAQRAGLTAGGSGPRPLSEPMVCTGPVRYTGHADLRFDIDNLLRASRGLDVQPFLSAVAPGTIEHWLWNEHYRTAEELLFAVADAMHEEYKAIVDAGIVVQIDDPDLPDGWQMDPQMTLAQYRGYARLRVEALNHALRGIP